MRTKECDKKTGGIGLAIVITKICRSCEKLNECLDKLYQAEKEKKLHEQRGQE